MLSVRLDPEIEDWLAAVARRAGKSKSECVREAVVGYLEDFDDRRVATERLESAARLWTLDELADDLDRAG